MSARPIATGRVALLGLAVLVGTAARGSAQAAYVPSAVHTAAVEVRLPADAELWFDGVATDQAGERRTFTTPPLNPGLTYTYDVMTRWRVGGQDVVRTERLILRAGASVVLDFAQAGAGPGHMAVRDITSARAPARVAAAAHDSLVEFSAAPPSRRRLPGFMAVTDLGPAAPPPATRTVPAVSGHMSIVEFGDPPR